MPRAVGGKALPAGYPRRIESGPAPNPPARPAARLYNTSHTDSRGAPETGGSVVTGLERDAIPPDPETPLTLQ